MPITFEPASPLNPQIDYASGQAQQSNTDMPLFQKQDDALLDAYKQAAQMKQADNHFYDSQADSVDKDQFAAQTQYGLQDQHAKLQAELMQTDLNAKEKVRLQQMQDAEVAVRSNPSLSQQDRDNYVMQLRTGVNGAPGINHYMERLHKSNELLHQQQIQQFNTANEQKAKADARRTEIYGMGVDKRIIKDDDGQWALQLDGKLDFHPYPKEATPKVEKAVPFPEHKVELDYLKLTQADNQKRIAKEAALHKAYTDIRKKAGATEGMEGSPTIEDEKEAWHRWNDFIQDPNRRPRTPQEIQAEVSQHVEDSRAKHGIAHPGAPGTSTLPQPGASVPTPPVMGPNDGPQQPGSVGPQQPATQQPQPGTAQQVPVNPQTTADVESRLAQARSQRPNVAGKLEGDPAKWGYDQADAVGKMDQQLKQYKGQPDNPYYAKAADFLGRAMDIYKETGGDKYMNEEQKAKFKKYLELQAKWKAAYVPATNTPTLRQQIVGAHRDAAQEIGRTVRGWVDDVRDAVRPDILERQKAAYELQQRMAALKKLHEESQE